MPLYRKMYLWGVEMKHIVDEAWTKAKTIDKSSLAYYFKKNEPRLSSTTLDWRIHELVRAGQIANVGRGRYTVKTKASYLPVLNARIRSLKASMQKAFPYLNYSIFHTEQLSSLMQHVPGQHLVVVETERDAMEAVFHHFQDLQEPAFLKPDIKTMERYVHLVPEPIVVQPLVSEAPLLEVEGCHIPTLEKVLVDLFCEKAIYMAYQGSELEYIFQNAFAGYHLRIDRLMRYADRRKRKREIVAFFSSCGIAIV